MYQPPSINKQKDYSPFLEEFITIERTPFEIKSRPVIGS
jgi:hypothetical protein